MPLLPRTNISRIEKACHGGSDYAELDNLGISPSEIIDFSSNLNPFIPLIEMKDITGRIAVNSYPDSESVVLRRAIAEKAGLSVDNIIAGNGSTELIRLVVTAYLGTDNNALIIEPTYGEYRIACEIAGASIIGQRLAESNRFEMDIDATVRLIIDNRPRAIFLCNPNNPTGYYLDRERFMRILKAAPDSLIILDEAYISFIEQAWSSFELVNNSNLLVVRSMTKDYSLAGLRLGYAVANREIIAVMNHVRPPWNVNAIAQAAGIIALQKKDALQGSLEKIQAGKRYLIEEIEKLGFRCLPSATNFFLVRVGNAAEFRAKLLKKSILVRDCTSFGLPEYIRIAVNTMENNRRLVSIMQEMAREI
jgi:histidinol-phosphate aminotransferase